jgi:hypothetical protein
MVPPTRAASILASETLQFCQEMQQTTVMFSKRWTEFIIRMIANGITVQQYH